MSVTFARSFNSSMVTVLCPSAPGRRKGVWLNSGISDNKLTWTFKFPSSLKVNPQNTIQIELLCMFAANRSWSTDTWWVNGICGYELSEDILWDVFPSDCSTSIITEAVCSIYTLDLDLFRTHTKIATLTCCMLICFVCRLQGCSTSSLVTSCGVVLYWWCLREALFIDQSVWINDITKSVYCCNNLINYSVVFRWFVSGMPNKDAVGSSWRYYLL